MKLRDDRMKICADLRDVYGASCVSHCTIYRWTEGFRAEKASLEDGQPPVHPISVRNEQTVLYVNKINEEDPQIINRLMCEKCDISFSTDEKTVRDDLNPTKIAAKWIPHLLTDQLKNRELNLLKILAQNVSIKWSQTPLRRPHR